MSLYDTEKLWMISSFDYEVFWHSYHNILIWIIVVQYKNASLSSITTNEKQFPIPMRLRQCLYSIHSPHSLTMFLLCGAWLIVEFWEMEPINVWTHAVFLPHPSILYPTTLQNIIIKTFFIRSERTREKRSERMRVVLSLIQSQIVKKDVREQNIRIFFVIPFLGMLELSLLASSRWIIILCLMIHPFKC